MRFGLWVATERPFDEILATALEAERLGYDAVYLADHFMPRTKPALQPRLESWTTLGALAARTARVRLGVLVTGNTYRHPAIVAKMAATVDRISNGRLVLGLGGGWQRNEHQAYGIELPEVPELLGRLDEACQVIRSLLDTTWSNFDGRWYRLVDAPCEPKAVQAHLPLLLGVAGEKIAMGIAARHADIWNYWGTPEHIAHKISVLDRHCEAAGRDPASLERSVQALVHLTDDPAGAEALLATGDRQPTLAGSPAEIGEHLARYRELGVSEFVLSDRTLGDSEAQRFENMDRFLSEAAAGLRH
ncbi:MAG TPA: TIGR03560 family F420-dependent LLM class oxidoreductase [Acidimicrobiales bacterium]|nr:TIGR03560 family F420-dependent LLM class oxidoreductase [Acidimicrobiales bacterium]